jgi:hypothetical protein
MKLPDVLLNLPPPATATVKTVRAALVETVKAMLATGYEPAVVARAMIGCGAMLAREFFDEAYALGELREIADQVRNTGGGKSARPN